METQLKENQKLSDMLLIVMMFVEGDGDTAERDPEAVRHVTYCDNVCGRRRRRS